MKDWVLDTGYTYLAITQEFGGTWAKGICPLAAAEEVKRRHRKTAVVYVYYGKDKYMYCGDLGDLMFNPQHPLPKPIGRYYITKRTVRSVTKKDWCGKNRTLRQLLPLAKWITEETKYFKNIRQKSTSLKNKGATHDDSHV